MLKKSTYVVMAVVAVICWWQLLKPTPASAETVEQPAVSINTAHSAGFQGVCEVCAVEPIHIPPKEKADTSENNAVSVDGAEAEMLARLVWGEARGVKSKTEQAAVIWCVLNRVDMSGCYADNIADVVTAPHQFGGYKEDNPVTDELFDLAVDVLTRWEQEKAGEADAGRVLPTEYIYFNGDGERNYFRTRWRGGSVWDWSLPSPYEVTE